MFSKESVFEFLVLGQSTAYQIGQIAGAIFIIVLIAAVVWKIVSKK